MDANDYLAKELTRLRLKLDKLALYTFIVLAISVGYLGYPSLAVWLGSAWGAAASFAVGGATFERWRRSTPANRLGVPSIRRQYQSY